MVARLTAGLARGERGGVSAIFVALMVAVLLLMMAILDREWLNYQLHRAEQTADFAAEAGAQSHQVWDTITVSRYHYTYIDLPLDCTTDPITGVESCTDPSYWSGPRFDTYTVGPAEEGDLLANWQRQASCGNPFQESPRRYACYGVSVTDREVRFDEQTITVAGGTFALNWQDRPHAEALLEGVTTRAADRSVTVRVSLDLGTPFGILPWRRQAVVEAMAVVQLKPLHIRP